jgi:hypothetical protein
MVAMALRFLEWLLREELAGRGREDLVAQAVDRIAFTDDGSTIYVHVYPRADWPGKAPGRAYVLAWHDYTDIQRLDCFRWLISEAKLNLRDHADQIARWLEGR